MVSDLFVSLFRDPTANVKTFTFATLINSNLTKSSLTSSSAYLSKARTLQLWASIMVVLPVFIQAPWVHFNPISALSFSLVIFAAGFYLIRFCGNKWTNIGSLLIGISWSWLGGCLFWGWLRDQPVWHLPVEAIVLPIACIALNSSWRIGASFYLSSLLGTAFTDLMIVVTGVMKSWPQVVNAPINQASEILSDTAEMLLNPVSFSLIIFAGVLIILLAIAMRNKAIPDSPGESSWLVASAALTTTLWVDGLFFLTTLIQPQLSGLI